ncbi:MAG: hypothetical protein Kow0065_05360 [Methylomicrobium sp.]
MNDQDSIEKDASTTPDKEMHPLLKLGVLTVGTKIGTEILLKLAKHPVLLLAMGVGTGIYINKHRKEIIDAAQELKEQGIAIVKKSD